LSSASGFSLALKRGSGDCPSGCIDSAYWYFGADSECKPIFLASYSATYNPEGNCYDVEGLPSWGIGREVSESVRCDFDPTAHDVSGEYSVAASGLTALCPDAEQSEWNGPLEFVVEQVANDLGNAEVVFKGIGLDDLTWPGTVVANEIRVDFTRSKSSCVDTKEVKFNYDVEKKTGGFHFFDVVSVDCNDPSADYCKGSVDLTLGE
jgi:hypothetical protein